MTRILLYTDPITEGYVILFSGLLIVFSGLVLLTLIFKFGLPLMLDFYNSLKPKPKSDKNAKTVSVKVKKEEFTGEVAAAISTAIHLYLNEQHDKENAILTIKQARKMYSPWSSKIYGTYSNRL
ncbi:MAG: OadG family protein [Flavobacteriaceae bacterium]